MTEYRAVTIAKYVSKSLPAMAPHGGCAGHFLREPDTITSKV